MAQAISTWLSTPARGRVRPWCMNKKRRLPANAEVGHADRSAPHLPGTGCSFASRSSVAALIDRAFLLVVPRRKVLGSRLDEAFPRGFNAAARVHRTDQPVRGMASRGTGTAIESCYRVSLRRSS